MKKKLLPLFILGFILIAYIGGLFYYSRGVFLENTLINNRNVSNMTADEVIKTFEDTSDLAMEISLDGKKESILLDTIDYNIEIGNEITDLLDKQTALSWPLSFFKKAEHEISFKTSYNEGLLEEQVGGLSIVSNPTIVDSRDAYIEAGDSGFHIVEEIYGNRLNLDSLKALVKDSLGKGIMQVEVPEDYYIKPEIKADDEALLKELASLKALEGLKVSMDMTGLTEEIDHPKFKEWLSFNENDEMVFDDEKLKAYVVSLADKYNTFGSVRKFNATGIGEINVGGSAADAYGFQLDISQTMDAIKAGFVNKEANIKPVWKIPALVRTPEGDIGNTYIEIDLTRQHMWFYKDGILQVDTPVITGKPASPTDVCVGRIWHKEKDRYLVGEGYRSHVDYWLPINWEGQGIHDASWQSSFGGELYKSRGSHGCINTPYDKAKLIYEGVGLDTPVVVYKS